MPTFIPHAPGEFGVRQTLMLMQSLVNRAYTHEIIRAQAVAATRHCGRADYRCQAASLLAWVRRKLHFVRDPHGVEALHDPVALAAAIRAGRMAYGDCDDFAMYLASLMKAIGLPATFRAVGFTGGPIKHVYVIGPGGMKLDPTRNEWNPSYGELMPETSALEMGV